MTFPDVSTLLAARHQLRITARDLSSQGIAHRAPPPEPSTCCGRGCNGCVWEGYYTALDYWHEQAADLLQAAAP